LILVPLSQLVSRPSGRNVRKGTGQSIDARRNPIVQFVGLDVYENTGGGIRRDLFADDDTGVYLADAALLESLAQDKLDGIAETVRAEGWSWVDVPPLRIIQTRISLLILSCRMPKASIKPQDKELIDDNENTAKGEVKRSVAAVERSLHVGHGRDVALEDGVYANEARAKIYMAAGRTAAGRMPELKNAAAVEAYIERKIKQKFPGDPVLLQRVMQTACNKISHAVAYGFDFPQPRVFAKTEIEKDQNQKREQNREHDRTHNRSR